MIPSEAHISFNHFLNVKFRAQRLGVQVFGRNWLRGGAQYSKVLPGADASRGVRKEVSVQEEEAQVGGGRGGGATEAGMSWLEGRSDCI